MLQWRVQALGTNDSAFSGNLQFELDATPPAVPGAFQVTTGTTVLTGGVGISGSGIASGATGYDKALDGNPGSYWATPLRAWFQTEFIVVDYGSPKSINEVRLLSQASSAIRFPVNFEIQVSLDNINYTTVSSTTGFVAAPANWYSFPFATASARYVRVWVTLSNNVNGILSVELAEVETIQATGGAGSVGLSWLTPGDDGNTGTADHLEVRYAATTLGSFDFATATPAAGVPPAAVAGA